MKPKHKSIYDIPYSEIDHIKFMNDMNRQFQHLKEAPIEEYLSRVCDIAKQLIDRIIEANKKWKYKNISLLLDMLDTTQQQELVKYLKLRAIDDNIKSTLVKVLLLLNL